MTLDLHVEKCAQITIVPSRRRRALGRAQPQDSLPIMRIRTRDQCDAMMCSKLAHHAVSPTRLLPVRPTALWKPIGDPYAVVSS